MDLFILIKQLYKKVMSFKAGNIQIGKKEDPQKTEAPLSSTKLDLNPEELEIILRGLKKSTFTGEQLETVYKLVLKLQNKYLSLIKK